MRAREIELLYSVCVGSTKVSTIVWGVQVFTISHHILLIPEALKRRRSSKEDPEAVCDSATKIQPSYDHFAISLPPFGAGYTGRGIMHSLIFLYIVLNTCLWLTLWGQCTRKGL